MPIPGVVCSSLVKPTQVVTPQIRCVVERLRSYERVVWRCHVLQAQPCAAVGDKIDGVLAVGFDLLADAAYGGSQGIETQGDLVIDHACRHCLCGVLGQQPEEPEVSVG